MSDIVYGADDRMRGVTGAVAALDDTRIVLANPDSEKLVTVAITGTAITDTSAQLLVLATSASLGCRPMAICANTEYVFALATDTLLRMPNSTAMNTEGYTVTAFPIECASPRWICQYGSFVFVPYLTGGVAAYTNAGVLIASYYNVLNESTLATVDADTGILYLIDSSHSRGVAFTIEDDGTLTGHPEFALTGCKDIVTVIADAAFLFVAGRERLTLLEFDDDRVAPTYTSHITMTERVNDAVRVQTHQWWIAAEKYVEHQADRFDYRNQFAVHLPGFGVFAVSAATGRVIGQADFNLYTPPDVGGEDSTFYILQEDTFLLFTEVGDKLEQE